MKELYSNHEDTNKSLEKETKPFYPHACFKYKGKVDSCNNCAVKSRGFCEEMIQILTHRKILGGLNEEAKNIIISETIIAVIKNISDFRGGSKPEFIAYVKKILRHKKADYLRKNYQPPSKFKLQDIKNIPSLIEQIKLRSSETIEYIYEEWLSEETKNLIDNSNLDSQQIASFILKDFNRIVDNKDNTGKTREFYNSTKMGDLEIPPEILELVFKKNKNRKDKIKANKALLELIFPALKSSGTDKIVELPLDEYEDKLRINPEFENKIYIEQLLLKIKEIDPDCKSLFEELYRGFQEGKNQKEIAEELGLKENTLNQKIKRCRERISKEGMLYDF